MENFQYSVQLSDQDWAEFSAAAEECGLLQAGLASGDEPLSSDTDQRDSSGSSPPGPSPFLEGQLTPGGSSWPSFEEEDKAATRQLVSRSWHEPMLAPEACQQTPSTSAQSEARLSLSPGATPLVQGSSLPGPVSSRDEMQRLLRGPAPRGPAPTPAGEPAGSPESPGHSAAPQRSPGSPGAPPRSPGRKKRRTAGTKAGGRSGGPGPAPTQLDSPLLTEAKPEDSLGPAGSRGKGLPAGAAKQTAGTGPESAGAPEQVAGQGPGVDLSTPVPTTEQGTDRLGMSPRADPCAASTSDPGAPLDVTIKSDVALSTPASEPQPDEPQSTPAFKPQPDEPQSTPAFKPQPDESQSTSAFNAQPNEPQSTPTFSPQPDEPQSTPAFKPQPDEPQSTPAFNAQPNEPQSTPAFSPQPDEPQSTPAFKPQPDEPQSTPAFNTQPNEPQSTPTFKPRLDVDQLMPGPVVQPEVDSSMPASKAVPCTALPHLVLEAGSDVGVSTPPAPTPQAGPDMVEAEVVPVAKLGLSPVRSLEGHQQNPRGEPSIDAPGHHTGEPPLGPIQAPKKKKVRFSVAMPSSEEPGSGEVSGPPSPATAPRMASGGHRGSGAWDSVAVGPRSPQPRILKHLPPPAPSASMGPGCRSCFAVTLPEAYDFFFCDTIQEEDEEAEGAAEAAQAPAEVQWPDVCEFFFQESQIQRSRHQEGRSQAPPLKAGPVPAPPPGDPMPISIPEAYEHFLEEDRSGGTLGPAALLQMQAPEPSRSVLWGVGTGAPPESSPATVEQLTLAIREAVAPGGPLTSFTFSQKDMCMVFVAFATWAVRTSDLHAPDAWKTVLLANIGTISAIRYFRRQVERGRHSRSRSPSPSSSPSP
ncbi:PREDICTED: PGC-1 and ERR-induced regulator in muscle protein 1 [Bison bison bison]|uniref:PGC-1 and ERR-induced regulator in muscle protein 1 n=1 Tax=Bison bison bison TaxID=43346 RepID=A0A6P3IBU0_BISBB|nr:PREDICTED: PGC-1 and ERR-induced regulator in muscle protein 1 [Bison bison bison]